MKIVIRRADITDIDNIVPLLEKLHASAGFAECAEFDELSAKAFTTRLIDTPSARILVAVDNEEIIGLSTFIIDSPYFNFSTKVASGISFWVEPEYRKLGVGKALYSASEKVAKALGCNRITVGVMFEDEYLQNYHERNGFKKREVLLHKVLIDGTGQES